jgi:hypothetical protein
MPYLALTEVISFSMNLATISASNPEKASLEKEFPAALG